MKGGTCVLFLKLPLDVVSTAVTHRDEKHADQKSAANLHTFVKN